MTVKASPQLIQDWLAAIRGTYLELLRRPVDPAGEAAYLFGFLNGLTLDAFRANIKASDEYKNLQQAPPPPPPPPARKLTKLSISGTTFRRDGAIHKYRGVTAFTLLQDLLVGKDVKPFLTWVQSLGANAVRVFGEWGTTNFKPNGDAYYNGLDALLTLCEWYGLDVHFVIFTSQGSTSPIRMSTSEQDGHFARVAKILQAHPNVIAEYNNEDWQNGQIASRFPQIAGVLCTRSAFQDGKTPSQAGTVLDFTTEHPPRDGEWPRKAKNGLETSRQGLGDKMPKGTGKPAILGEPIGINESDVPGRRSSDPRKFADFFSVAELFTAGACLHGDMTNLMSCIIPTGKALECALAVKAVWAAGIPLDAASAGQYTRPGLNDCPVKDNGALRIYAMNQGSQSTAVVVGGDVNPDPVLPWHVAAHAGPNGQILRLQR